MAVQDHIHIGATLTGAPEYAPADTYKVTWPSGREPIFEGVISFDRSWTGTPFFGSIVDGQGKPVFFKSFRYTLRVTLEQEADLLDLLFQTVYAVDNIHCADGQDHTTYVRTMRLAELKETSTYDPDLNRLDIQISLLDEDTV
jgi:hypothetical protein